MSKIIFKFHINERVLQLKSYDVDLLIKMQRDYMRAWMYKKFMAYFEMHMIEYSYMRIINDTNAELIFVVNKVDDIDYVPIIMYQIQWYIDHRAFLDRIASYDIYYEE